MLPDLSFQLTREATPQLIDVFTSQDNHQTLVAAPSNFSDKGLSGGVISSLFIIKVRFNSSNLTLSRMTHEVKSRSKE